MSMDQLKNNYRKLEHSLNVGIHINDRLAKAVTVPADEFNTILNEYIMNKITTQSYHTDNTNSNTIIKCPNYIYLDGDYEIDVVLSGERFNELNWKMAINYLQLWEEQLISMGYSRYNYYIFIPEYTQSTKGGFHIFIITTDTMTSKQRVTIYNNIEKLNVNYKSIMTKYNVIDKDYNSLYDTTPLNGVSNLIPFAEKIDAKRHYILVNYRSMHCGQEIQYEYIQLMQSAREAPADALIITPLDEHIVTFDNKYDIDKLDSSNELYYIVGHGNIPLLKFINSLQYLHANHPFWRYISNHDNKRSFIILVVNAMTMISGIQYIDYGYGLINEEDMSKFICSSMLSIMRRSKDIFKDDNSKRDLYESLYTNIREIVTWEATRSKRQMLMDIKSKKIEAENAPKADRADAMQEYKLYRITVLRKEYSVNTLLCWIIEHIYKKMEQDIYPFDNSFKYTAEQDVNHDLYKKVMKIWYTFGYIIFAIDEKCNTLSGYSELIKYTTKNFIGSNSASNDHLYIYNVNQSIALYGYPYNQWIEDINDNIIVSWYRNIYDDYIVSSLSSLSSDGMSYSLFSQILIASLSQSINDIISQRDIINMTKKVNSYALDIKSIYTNVEQYSKSRGNMNIIDAALAPIFPCHNGILEFKDDGKYEFKTNNYNYMYTGYTNMMYYDPNQYDKECEAYQFMTQTLHNIMPCKDQYDYVLSILSCILHGMGNRDLFLILKGSGADGKTTLCNILLAMLGAPGFEPCAGQCIKQSRKNPGGLADTIQADVILHKGANLPTSHQSGGIVKLKNKRFVVIQEPDSDNSISTIKSNIIKDITSGSTLTAREIRERAMTFLVRCLFVLQSNNDIRFTENDVGMYRRLAVINMMAKFYQPSTEYEFELKQYKFRADPTLNDRIRNDPACWEAMFQILLPYALDTIRKHKGTPSNIPRPDSVELDTKTILGLSYGIDEVINKYIEVAPNSCISVYGLFRKIYDNGFPDIRKRPQEQTIKSKIFSKYINKVVIVTDEEYEDKVIAHGPINSNRPFITNIDRMIEEDGEWKVIRKVLKYISKSDVGIYKSFTMNDIHLNKYAVHAISESTDSDYKDLFIVGYKFANETSSMF